MLRPRYWLIALYDRAYRLCHRLDTPRSEVGAALRLELSWATHALRLSDGTLIARGDRIGILHMNNDRVRALHIEGLSPIAVGLEFRREIVGSLRALAVVAGPGGWADRATAFAATTIFHHGLPRLGFERDPTPPPFPHVIAAYQRSLLGVLHPAGAHRLVRLANTHVERLWLSRVRLLALYGQRQRAVS